MDEYIMVNGRLYRAVDRAPEPPKVLGFAVGDCKTYTKHGKHVLNRQLWQAKFRDWKHTPSMSVIERARDGAKFIAYHEATYTEFERVA